MRRCRHLSATARLAGLGLLWLALTVGAWRAFPLAVLYQTPLLDLAGLAARREAVWFGALVVIVLWNFVFLAGWRVMRRARTPVSWSLLLGLPAAVAALLMLTYPLTAADLFDYLALGHLTAFRQANPFTQTPAQFPADPFVRYAAWRNFPSAYGPLWELLAAALAHLAHGNLWRGILLMKGQALVSLAAVSVLVAALTPQGVGRSLRMQQALFALLWNPLLLFDIAGNGHNDLWMALPLAAALLLWERGRVALALPALAAGVLVKLAPLLLAPLFVVSAARRRAWAQLLIGTALSGLLIWLCFRPFWPLSDPLRLAQRSGLYTTSWLRLLHDLTLAWVGAPAADALVGRLAAGLLVGAVGLSAWRLWRSRRPDLVTAAMRLLIAVLLVTTAWFQTWYLAWVWPLAAVRPHLRWQRVLLLLSVTSWFKYVLFSLTFGAHKPPLTPYWRQEVGAALLVMAVPLFAGGLKWRSNPGRRFRAGRSITTNG